MWYGCQLYCPGRKRTSECPHTSYPFPEPPVMPTQLRSVGNGAETGKCSTQAQHLLLPRLPARFKLVRIHFAPSCLPPLLSASQTACP